MKKKLILAGVCCLSLVSIAALTPHRVHVAEAKKSEAYVKDGVIVGGDRALDQVVVRDIRRAANSGYERIVIDLGAHRNGEQVAIPRPPYYQVAVSPDEKRLVFTVWGNPKLGFEPQKVMQAFKKSPVIQSVELFPRLEKDYWTFVMGLKSGRPVEVFELTDPVRIIVDVKLDAQQMGKQSSHPASHVPAKVMKK